jgi:mRNA interferase MazF
MTFDVKACGARIRELRMKNGLTQETLTIVPLTSQLKRPDLESHYILQKAGFLKKRSMALAEAINTIDKRQIRFYLGRLSDDDMAGIDAAITSHLGYEIAWCMEAP